MNGWVVHKADNSAVTTIYGRPGRCDTPMVRDATLRGDDGSLVSSEEINIDGQPAYARVGKRDYISRWTFDCSATAGF